jgi:predicted dinucleotide-binding enzyme
MKIGVLGSGSVGKAIATALTEKGHQVKMGSRDRNNEKVLEWVKNNKDASSGTFDEAAEFGELLFLCLNGSYTLDAIKSIKEVHTNGKIMVDITNPLDFTHGMPPRLIESLSNSTSLGEEIQKLLPGTQVVKTLNTVNYKLMVNAAEVNGGDHHLFLCGNDTDAKNKVKHLLVDNFHWKADHLIDIGNIKHARTIEAIVPFWVSVWQALGTPLFNFKIVKADS